jgi:hypothetical protein
VLDAKVDGAGTRVRAVLNLSTLDDGTWQLTEGELDLATWFPAAAEQTGDALQGLSVAGTVKISGGGAVRAGEASGNVQVTMRDGRIGNAGGGWSLEGVTMTGEFTLEAPGFRVKSAKPLELTAGTITTSRFGARNVSLRGVLNEDRTLSLGEARIEIAGGEVTLDPTTVALSPFAVEATLHIVNVGLQDIAALVPASLSSAHGRIDGTLRLGWLGAKGLHLGNGNLNLSNSELATVQLAPAPGFLTRSMPKRFEPLPTWTGPLGRWLSADNPVYTAMEEIELGRAPLAVESLSVQLTPDGDELGRTATVRMVARPATAGAAVKTVNIDVNVAGPLDSLLKLGMNEQFSVEAH